MEVHPLTEQNGFTTKDSKSVSQLDHILSVLDRVQNPYNT